MKEVVFIANTYRVARNMLTYFIENQSLKDIIEVRNHPFSYVLSIKYSCATTNSLASLRGIKFETIYLHPNVSYEFVNEVLPSLHYENMVIWKLNY